MFDFSFVLYIQIGAGVGMIGGGVRARGITIAASLEVWNVIEESLVRKGGLVKIGIKGRGLEV